MVAEVGSFGVLYKPNETHRYDFDKDLVESLVRDVVALSVFGDSAGQWTIYLDVKHPVAPGRKPSKWKLGVAATGKENYLQLTVPAAWIYRRQAPRQSVRFYLYPPIKELACSIDDVVTAVDAAASLYNRQRGATERTNATGEAAEGPLGDMPELILRSLRLETGNVPAEELENCLLAIAVETSNGVIDPGACRVAIADQLEINSRDPRVDEVIRSLIQIGWLTNGRTQFSLSPEALEQCGLTQAATDEGDDMTQIQAKINHFETLLKGAETQTGVRLSLRDLLPQAGLTDEQCLQAMGWLDEAETRMAATSEKLATLRRAAEILSEDQ